MGSITDEFCREFFNGSNDICNTGGDRASRHAVIFRVRRILYHHHPQLLLDRPEANRSVRSHAGEDDPDAPLLLVLGEVLKEEIDREAKTPGGGRHHQLELAVEDCHVPVGRDDVNTIRPDLHAVLCLKDLHRGDPLDEFGHDALMGWVEVGDEYVGKAGISGKVVEELHESLQ